MPFGQRPGVTRGPELSTFSGPIRFPVTGRTQPAASSAPASNAAPGTIAMRVQSCNHALSICKDRSITYDIATCSCKGSHQLPHMLSIAKCRNGPMRMACIEWAQIRALSLGAGPSRLSGTAAAAPQLSMAAPPSAMREGLSAARPTHLPLLAVNPAATQAVSNPFETSSVSDTVTAAREADIVPIASSAAESRSFTLPPNEARGLGASVPIAASGSAPTANAASMTQQMKGALEATALHSRTGNQTHAETGDAAGERRSSEGELAGPKNQALAASLGEGSNDAKGRSSSGPDGLRAEPEGTSLAERGCEQLEQVMNPDDETWPAIRTPH